MTNAKTRPPTDAEIRQALERVVGSEIFERSARARTFLRFVVEETLAGRGQRLKGFTIAVAVFGRGEDFDSQQDPLVRVEARRLRQRLLEYYSGPGADDPVRFELPRGQYMPTFHRPDDRGDATGAPAAAAASVTETPRRHWTWPAAAVIAAGIAAIWTLLSPVSTVDDTRSIEPPAPGRPIRLPRLVVLPVETLSDDSRVTALASGLTEELNLEFVAYNIVSTASSPGSTLTAVPLATLREDFDAGYALAGSARRDNGGIRVAFRLLETDDGTQLWSSAFNSGSEPVEAFAESLARRVAMLMSTPFGPIFGREIQLVEGKPAGDLDTYECMMRFFEYLRTIDPVLHRDSVACTERAVQTDPQSDWSWAALALLYLHEHEFAYTAQPERGPPLDRALEAVRRALDINGSNRIGAVALPSILLGMGDRDGFLRAADRALEIEPEHPAVFSQIGFILTAFGDWQRGVPLIERSLPLTTDLPGWYLAAFAFQRLETGDYQAALDRALEIDAPQWFVTPLTVAASAALAGRPDLAEREIARLLERYPDFGADGRARLAAMGLGDVLRARLIEGLALAGLPLD